MISASLNPSLATLASLFTHTYHMQVGLTEKLVANWLVVFFKVVLLPEMQVHYTITFLHLQGKTTMIQCLIHWAYTAKLSEAQRVKITAYK